MKMQRIGAAIKVIKKVLSQWSGANVEKVNQTRKGSASLRKQVSYTNYIIKTSPRILSVLDKIKPFNALESLLIFIKDNELTIDNLSNNLDLDIKLKFQGNVALTHLETETETETGDRDKFKQYASMVQQTVTNLNSNDGVITLQSIFIVKQTNEISHKLNSTNLVESTITNPSCKLVPIVGITPQVNIQKETQPIQINALELIVDFTLKYHSNINPKHLTNRIRQVGYYKAFNSLRIKSKPITTDIDKYLKSFKIPDLHWKSLGIKPDTIFPNVSTKYDY
jgi:hypothetical protein